MLDDIDKEDPIYDTPEKIIQAVILHSFTHETPENIFFTVTSIQRELESNIQFLGNSPDGTMSEETELFFLATNFEIIQSVTNQLVKYNILMEKAMLDKNGQMQKIYMLRPERLKSPRNILDLNHNPEPEDFLPNLSI